MKKAIPSFILLFLLILSCNPCYAGNNSNPCYDRKNYNNWKTLDDFYSGVCSFYSDDIDGDGIFRDMMKFVADSYKIKTNITDIYDCLDCKVEVGFGEEKEYTPFEAAVIAGSHMMIYYTINEYQGVNLRGLKSALLRHKGDQTLLELLWEYHDSSDDSLIKTDIKKVIKSVQAVLDTK